MSQLRKIRKAARRNFVSKAASSIGQRANYYKGLGKDEETALELAVRDLYPAQADELLSKDGNAPVQS